MDLIGYDEATGDVVVVEKQLEQPHHTHLVRSSPMRRDRPTRTFASRILGYEAVIRRTGTVMPVECPSKQRRHVASVRDMSRPSIRAAPVRHPPGQAVPRAEA